MVLVFVLGMVLGSFAHATAWRFHRGMTLFGRSICPSCHRTLRARDLVPVLSWAFSRGMCRYCNARISWYYLFSEILSGFLFVGIVARHPDPASEWPAILFEAVVMTALLICVFMDLRWKELPVELMAAGMLGAIVFHLAVTGVPIHGMVSALAIPAFFLGGQWILSKGAWIGSGDIFLGLFLAAALGAWEPVVVMLYATYVGGGILVAVLLCAKAVKHGARIPFAPLLGSGFLVALWFGGGIAGAVRAMFSV